MSLIVRTTRVACNTSTGTQDITISGFGTPVAALFILQNTTADGTVADGIVASIGATDGTLQWVNNVNEENGNDTTDTQVFSSTSYCVRGFSDADGTADSSAAFSTWITDGVRINWDNASGAAYLLTVVLFGGTDLTNAYAGTYTQNNTVDAATDVTGLGFRPTDLFLSRTLSNNATNGFNFGVVHENGSGTVTQGCMSMVPRGGVGTSAVGARITDTYGIASGVYNGTFYSPQEIGSFDADGFSSTTRLNNTAAATSVVCYLALRITNHSSYKGSFTTPTSTGNDSQTGAGFKPQFLLQVCGACEAVDTAYEDNRGGTFGISVADATAQYSNSWASEDGADTSNCESLTENQMVELHDDDGGALIETTFVSFDTNGWTQNFTTASAAGKVWLVWAVEEEAGGITEDIGLAAETDTPQSLSTAKSKALSLETESDTPLALVTAKTLAIGLAAETETVLGLTSLKTRSIGLSTETDTPLGIVLPTIQAIGLAAETDTPLGLTAVKTRAIGLATESDAALALAAVKARAIGLATEADTPLAITAAGAVEIGLAAETDTPLGMTAIKTAQLGLVVESDTPLSATAAKSRTLGLVTETDTTLALTMLKLLALGLLTETDTPLALSGYEAVSQRGTAATTLSLVGGAAGSLAVMGGAAADEDGIGGVTVEEG